MLPTCDRIFSLLWWAVPAVWSLICVFIITPQSDKHWPVLKFKEEPVIFMRVLRLYGRNTFKTYLKGTHHIPVFHRRGEGGSSPDFSRWHTSPPEPCPSLGSAASYQQTRCRCCHGHNWNKYSTIKLLILLWQLRKKLTRAKLSQLVVLYEAVWWMPHRSGFTFIKRDSRVSKCTKILL